MRNTGEDECTINVVLKVNLNIRHKKCNNIITFLISVDLVLYTLLM